MLARTANRSVPPWLLVAVACRSAAGTLCAQGRGPVEPPIPPPNPTSDPLLRGFEFRSIGPAARMGRVDDIAGADKDPMLIDVGAAAGGLLEPGAYMVRLTVVGQIPASSVTILEDIWMRPR
jgi:hypothetical protein